MIRAVIFMLILSSCASSKAKFKEIDKLRFINDQIIDTNKKLDAIPFGGISGLEKDYNNKNIYYAISDDRGNYGPIRAYKMTLKRSERTENFTLIPTNTIRLKTKVGNLLAKNSIDPEGIRIDSEGNLLISTEGEARNNSSKIPNVLKFTKNGKLIQTYKPHRKYLPEKRKGIFYKGVRNNAGFESLALNRDNNTMYVASEQSLLQDGDFSSSKSKTPVRIIESKDLKYTNEYVYFLDPIPNPRGLDKITGINGLVELLHISDKKFIAVERSFILETLTNDIRLYIIDLNQEKLTNVKRLKSLKSRKIYSIKKKLLANLNEFSHLLSRNSRIDNIEAITWGPELENGNRTLILASDNNFRESQISQFIFLELYKKTIELRK